MHLLKPVLRGAATVLAATLVLVVAPATGQNPELISPPPPAGPAGAMPPALDQLGPPSPGGLPGTMQGLNAQFGGMQIGPDGRYMAPGQPADAQREDEYHSRILDDCATKLQNPYTMSSDVVFMQITQPGGISLVRGINTGTPPFIPGPTILSTDDLQTDLEPGPRIKMSVRTDEKVTFEIGYFGIYSWDASATAVSTDNLVTPNVYFPSGTILSDYYAADAMALTASTRLTSVEFNLVYGEDPGKPSDLAYFVGFRYIRLQDRFELRTFNNFVTGPNAFEYVSAYDIEALNNLYGGQFGVRSRACLLGCELRLSVDFGLYSNQSRQTSTATDVDADILARSERPHRSGIAYGTDFSVRLSRQLGGGVAVHAGYDLTLINSVARGFDQIDFASNTGAGTTVQWRDGTLIHGPSLGLEARW